MVGLVRDCVMSKLVVPSHLLVMKTNLTITKVFMLNNGRFKLETLGKKPSLNSGLMSASSVHSTN